MIDFVPWLAFVSAVAFALALRLNASTQYAELRNLREKLKRSQARAETLQDALNEIAKPLDGTPFAYNEHLVLKLEDASRDKAQLMKLVMSEGFPQYASVLREFVQVRNVELMRRISLAQFVSFPAAPYSSVRRRASAQP
jgi:hypothetical protein